MNKTMKIVSGIAAAAVLSLTMLQTAFAASWNYSSLFSSMYGTQMPNTTTTTPYTTGTTQKSTGSTTQSLDTTTQSTGSTTKSTSTTTNSASAQSVSSSSSSESQMISLINQDRGKAGLSALRNDSGLHAGALSHSQDMAKNNYFSHTSPTYGTFAQRAATSGAGVSAENIALNGSVAGAEASFMGSDGHRANILNPNYTRVGVGIVYSSSRGGYYITQWFGR